MPYETLLLILLSPASLFLLNAVGITTSRLLNYITQSLIYNIGLSFFLLASILARGINLSSFNTFQFLKTQKYSITSSKISKKLCHTTNPPTALPVGVSWVRPPESGITPLTCTIFDPSFTALIYPRISFRLLRLHFLKLAQTGQNGCWSVTLSTFPEQGHKSAHERSHGVISLFTI